MLDAPYLLVDGGSLGTLEAYRALGGGAGLDAARALGPEATIDEIEASGLRGRGGAGFSTGRKWRAVAGGGPEMGDRFVAVNAAEGEPGTFKDRALLRHNPYQVLEGALIAATAVGARSVFVALKASFQRERERLEAAVAEIEAAGWSDGITVTIVAGPEEYLFGEEKALLAVIEGEEPLPRLFPPYIHGLFSTAPQVGWSAAADAPTTTASEPGSNPTVVNNAETLANVAHILRHGADWYRTMGTPESPGHVLVTVSGDTLHAGVGEVAMGTPLGDALEQIGGGMPAGRSLKGVLSGVANPVLHPDALGTRLTYEDMAAAGSGLGSAGFLVFDDTRNMVEVAYWVSAFLYVESCGQCPACKFGTGEVTAYLHRMLSGESAPTVLDVIARRLTTVDDAARCGLAAQERVVVSSILQGYPDDVTAVLEGAARLAQRPLVGTIVDIADGVAVRNERQDHKRPDWTYAETPVVIS